MWWRRRRVWLRASGMDVLPYLLCQLEEATSRRQVLGGALNSEDSRCPTTSVLFSPFSEI